MSEFKSFLKMAGGGEGGRCKYPLRLDTYGCGCQHDCSYCYAKSLLAFRGLWKPGDPAVADIRKVVKSLPKVDRIVRLGGMTDCFAPIERQKKVTFKTIEFLNAMGKGYLIVTKSDLVADDEYVRLMDKKLAHIQVTVTSTRDEVAAKYEKATPVSKRMAAIEKLAGLGFDTTIRISPFVPQWIDVEVVNAIKCDKLLVEFLRVNTWVKRWMADVDFSEYTVKKGGYQHLPLEKKRELIAGFRKARMSVCEDVDEHFEWWKNNFNQNKEDCCNLDV